MQRALRWRSATSRMWRCSRLVCPEP